MRLELIGIFICNLFGEQTYLCSVSLAICILLGGGTLDVSILWLQGGIFVTRAMAGNNRLGGQDFNERVQNHLMAVIYRL